MTISSTDSRKSYVGNGVTTSFGTSPVVFFTSADLKVYVVVTATGAATLLTENTHYTVTGGSGSTGTIDTSAGSSPYGAPSALQTLLIVRDVAITQLTDFVNNDASDAEVAEDVVDKLTMITQQLDSRLDRSFVLADSDVSGASTELPTPSASGLLGWNSAGTALQNYTAADIGVSLVSGFGATLIDDANANDARVTLGFSAVAAKGDLFVGTAANTIGTKTVGTNGQVLQADSNQTGGVRWAGPFQKYIAGLTYANNAGDATNDIDIAAGCAMDSTNVDMITLASAITKQLDAAWAVGTNAGGLDTGSIGNSDYYIWLIKRVDTGVVDVLFSLSSTAPTMPTNYTLKRLIGWFKRVSAAIVAFHTYETEGGGIEMNWDSPTLDVNLANTLTTSRRTDALKVPLTFSVTAHFNLKLVDATAPFVVLFYCPDQSDIDPAGVGLFNTSGITATASANGYQMRVRTSSAGLIAARSTLATVDSCQIATVGFTWARRN